jgi:DNA-directed RNA polymerase specialized sigma24 family protein
MENAATASIEQGMTRATSDHIFRQRARESFANREHSELFHEWFSRCRRLLHFTACRVLGGSEGAELAVQNCWLTASRNPPTFDHEGAFRSWLLRVLIDEAAAILQGLPRRLDDEHAHTSVGSRVCR